MICVKLLFCTAQIHFCMIVCVINHIPIAQKYRTDQIQVCVFACLNTCMSKYLHVLILACLNTWAMGLYRHMSGKWLKPLQFP